MEKKTFKVIVILVGLLFLNIEAAHAGLVHKFKLFIRTEFSDFQLLYVVGALVIFAFLIYIVFSPVRIGQEKWSWINYYTYNPSRQNYHNKRLIVSRISDILKNN